jgi:hypothetical protein
MKPFMSSAESSRDPSGDDARVCSLRRNETTLLTLLVMIAAVASTGLSAGQNAPAARLASATAVHCRFSTVATVGWQGGEPRASQKPVTLTLAFEAVNIEEGSARSAEQNGVVDVTVRFANDVLHFMQSFREGPLYVTSIFPVAADGSRLIAVHSRHEFTKVQVPGFTSRPEQYYGSCEITP